MHITGKTVKQYGLAGLICLSTVAACNNAFNNYNKNYEKKLYSTLNNDVFQRQSDEDKVIEFNKVKKELTNGRKSDNYAIVDKKQCKLTVYNSDGDVLETYSVGLGSRIGDRLGSGSALEKTDSNYRKGEYTTPGEFTLDEVPVNRRSEKSKKLYGERIIYLKGDNKGSHSTQEAIHQTSSTYGKKRLLNDKNGVMKDNRFSSGCVVMLPEEYDDLMTYIGEGDKVYILPEEKGNQLVLKHDKLGVHFVQKYHKNQKRDMSPEEASKVIYDVNPKKADNLKNMVVGWLYSLAK